MDSRQFIEINTIQKRFVLLINLFLAQNDLFYWISTGPESEPPGAGFFLLEPESTQIEPEPAPGPRTFAAGAAKKVAAPEHWV